jgi:hypothetical protein
MTNKFEQLIEYVINDEEDKARELFHEIVVEKSRGIYEEMMKKDELEEAESTEQEDEKAERAGRKVTKDIEYDDKKDKMHEGEDLDEALGGDQADDLIDDVEVEEVGLGEADGEDDHHADMGGNEELEDRVVDLEKEVEELMAEFEKLMGDDNMGSDDLDMDVEVDDVDLGSDMDAEEVVDDELETESMKMPMEEAVNLKAAPKAVTSEESGINTKPVVAANSGAKGAVAKPVKTDTAAETGRSAPTTKDLIGKVQNTPAQNTVKLGDAPKPQLKQETGVNTKTPFPKQ